MPFQPLELFDRVNHRNLLQGLRDTLTDQLGDLDGALLDEPAASDLHLRRAAELIADARNEVLLALHEMSWGRGTHEGEHAATR